MGRCKSEREDFVDKHLKKGGNSVGSDASVRISNQILHIKVAGGHGSRVYKCQCAQCPDGSKFEGSLGGGQEKLQDFWKRF